jgi:hypothetical protein
MDATNLKVGQQLFEYWRIPSLACPDEDHHRQSVALDEVMDLGAQPTSGPSDAVIRRLDARIGVIRPSPP